MIINNYTEYEEACIYHNNLDYFTIYKSSGLNIGISGIAVFEKNIFKDAHLIFHNSLLFIKDVALNF